VFIFQEKINIFHYNIQWSNIFWIYVLYLIIIIKYEWKRQKQILIPQSCVKFGTGNMRSEKTFVASLLGYTLGPSRSIKIIHATLFQRKVGLFCHNDKCLDTSLRRIGDKVRILNAVIEPPLFPIHNGARKRNNKKRNISMEDLAAHSPQKIIIGTVLFMV